MKTLKLFLAGLFIFTLSTAFAQTSSSADKKWQDNWDKFVQSHPADAEYMRTHKDEVKSSGLTPKAWYHKNLKDNDKNMNGNADGNGGGDKKGMTQDGKQKGEKMGDSKKEKIKEHKTDKHDGNMKK